MPFREPTVGDVENIMRTTGARSAWAIAEEARRQQLQGGQAFMSSYTEQETPQQRAAKQRAADAAMKKLLGMLSQPSSYSCIRCKLKGRSCS